MTALNPVLSIATPGDRHPVPRRSEPSRREAPRARSRCCGASASRTPSAGSTAIPHEFSGGMRQRICIAMALIAGPGPADRRRADHRARRHAGGADHPAAARAAGRGRGLDPVRLAPSGAGRRAVRPGRRHVCRRGGRERHRCAMCSTGRSTPTPERCSLCDPARIEPADARAADHRGRRAEPDRAAAGLRLPAALSARLRALPRAAAALSGGCRATSPAAILLDHG